MFRCSLLTLSSLSFSLAADSARPGRMKQSDIRSFREKKRTIAPTFHWLKEKLGVKRERKKTKNKTWSSFVVSLHPSFMFVREKPKQVFVSCSGKVLAVFSTESQCYKKSPGSTFCVISGFILKCKPVLRCLV